MKNGLAENCELNKQSIHFMQIPSFDEDLINEDIEKSVKRMQNAIETGRTIRDKVNISMKYPLRTVKLVEADPTILESFKTLEKYIKEELNCFNLELLSQEDDFIQYTADPENRMMGQAFGKAYDKNLKKAISSLTSDQIRTYIASGSIEVNGKNITNGMLKVNKSFKKEYAESKKWDCASSMLSSVMLDTEMDEELNQIGLAREVINRIQRLRKTSGISIEDQIEVFFEIEGEKLAPVIEKHSEKVVSVTKMPFLALNERQSHAILIGETEFAHPDNEAEKVKLTICLAAPSFDEAKLQASFADQFKDSPSFVNDLKSFVLLHDA